MSKTALSLVAGSVDWDRPFLEDQAHQFLAVELKHSARPVGLRDNILLERCTAYLMAMANCSKRTAATQAAQAIAEISSARSRVSLDMDRSTSHALFVVERASGNTRVISAAELTAILDAHDAAQASRQARPH
ncbi:hypothetical protein LMG26858_01681 [Achromobacter anxifer]|uniref:Uncharacterized protein n=1 Tax=Achromobacter anxifer TaxID=1287737 RepID=A0A6S7CSR9_9BURK|nr:hypothetical protein [Achromobacter anxifer]CAB3850476.1 hypothetical protein LMG26858_01681 [Achromobacter anxifer]